MTECNREPLLFSSLNRQEIVADFDGLNSFPFPTADVCDCAVTQTERFTAIGAL